MHDGVLTNKTAATSESLIEIEIVYAKAEEQVLVGLKLPEGSIVEEAVKASGLLDRFPEIDLSVNKFGVFGCVCSLDRILQRNDRVEIYRPLLHDPKDSRKQRASKR